MTPRTKQTFTEEQKAETSLLLNSTRLGLLVSHILPLINTARQGIKKYRNALIQLAI